jgi:DNA-binding NarL/FixJ family response regulator
MAITGGYFVDITHIKRLGQPLITINHDGEVLHLFESTDDELVKDKLTSFTLRELEILRLVYSGSTTGEIAAKTGLTKSTIYAHRRNILAKSELPSMSKLISSLKKSGIFSLVGYSSIALLGEPLIEQIFSAAACI